ncbi:S41 family peptidase [Peterkaempfera griseoplana]|uniref:S41 family peptidase n=1 Tax=Peterkaempfera griseoplana TaxID=66896 RepID=UPI0006E1DF36|nr:S41 family peptidase [Peterkaempfera griseoplana]
MAESSYLRYPHVARDLITFAAEDDIWLASLSEAADGRGTRAWRLTADQVPVLHPRLNPSATHVAWTSTRDGTRSLHRRAPREALAVPVEGGPARRLTYWGDRFATVRGWVGDDEVLVLSGAGRPASMQTWAFAVPLRGPARRLDHGPVGDVSVREGAVLVGSAMNFEPADPAEWKQYRGGAGGRIWYSPDGARYSRILAEVGDNLVNPMFVGPRVVFLSDHEGTGALYSALPDGSGLRRHTALGEYYARHATTDGGRVVYQQAGEIWMLPSLDAGPVRLDIRLHGDRSGRAPHPVTARSQLRSFTLDSHGLAVAAEVRGTVHWLPGRDGTARALLAEPGVRGRIPVIIPGREAVACASDRGGEDGLDVIPADGSPPRRIGHGEFGRILELAVSPDGRLAALACADGRLLTVALDGEPVVTELARSTNEEVSGLAFSPDSALLAWSQPWRPERRGSQIRLARLADGTVTDVTPRRFDDTSPAFTLDGRYLVFLSNRAFDPVYDAHTLDLGFLPGVRPYLVTLSATTPSPFAPRSDGRPAAPGGPGPLRATGVTEAELRAVDLDVAGLADRIVPFPVAAGRFEKLRAARDGVVWLDLPRPGELGEAAIGADEERPVRLVRYDLARCRRSVEAEGLGDYAVSADGTRLAYRTGGSLEIRPVGGSGGEAVGVDLDRIRVTVDPPAEWRQMYHETWRLMRDNFWRADMAGVDWAAMGDRYRPLLDRIGCADDLHDVLRELQGETRTSHTGVLPPSPGGDPATAQGLLGADLEPTRDGSWRIVRILPGESSVTGARSPLAAPGVAAAPGDAVVAVDGQPVDPDLGPNALLVGKADRPVELTLRRDGADRRALVVPLATEHATRYHDQVARQRAAVREASGGRLGYLHILGTNPAGWAELHRDLYTESQRDGLIVDVRNSQGGDASHLIAEKLARRVIGWSMARYEEPLSYPSEAPRGPIVAISNEYASSGGDIVTQALKSYRIATVVGTRTWGGVISCYFNELVDGTLVTQPTSALWFADAGWTVDNHGVDPDVEVAVAPHDWAAGRDPQLETAVRLALRALEGSRPAAPPTD